MTIQSPTLARATFAQSVESLASDHVVVRAFRGTRLYLMGTGIHSAYLWSTDPTKAQRLTSAAALRAAAGAASEYGADCAALAADGALIQPAAAVPHAKVLPKRPRVTDHATIAAKRAAGLAAMSPGRPKGSKNGVRS